MEAQENYQTEKNAQAHKKRELALVSRSTYIKEKALQDVYKRQPATPYVAR